MRILLIAYEFPPTPSPQSLRWTYLVRELAGQGHEVHVLTPDVIGYGPGGLPEVPDTVRVHRTFAGPLMGMLALRARRKKRIDPTPIGSVTAQPTLPSERVELDWNGRVWPAELNWKGRLFRSLKALAAVVMYPDSRAEWTPWARWRLKKLLRQIEPDIVVASHEPANTLKLGLLAKSLGHVFFADLGDPVLAPYTPARWRKRAHSIEAAVCSRADHVTVTCEGARELMMRRHGIAADRISVLTQGFDDRLPEVDPAQRPTLFDDRRLELLYAGSFYTFRRTDALLKAVLATSGVRLNIATANAPAELIDASLAHPEQIRILGFVSHRDTLFLQRHADVLVNIGNSDPSQVPGKIYEYLGSGRPILHLGDNADDAARQLVGRMRAGWCCRSDPVQIAHLLNRLRQSVGLGEALRGVPKSDAAQYGWSRTARALAEILRRAGARS